jgi:hypothetical protein
MHGALHIFDAGTELQKFTWCNTGIALIDQIRQALDDDRFPLFVAEGTANSKLQRIEHSGYLCRAKRSFAQIGGDLFIYGFSFGDADDHILRVLRKNRVARAFISLYGDSHSAGNLRIIQRAELVAGQRGRNSLELIYFDAASASVWG